MSALFCIPAAAEGSSYEVLPISVTKTWPENITYSQSADNYITINVPYPALANKVSTIWTCHNEDTKNYYHYKFVFVTSVIEPYNFTCTFDGVEYEVKKDYNVENTYYIEIENIKISSPSARLDFNFSFSNNTSGHLYFLAYYQYSDLNPVIDNQNENTDKIIGNQNQISSDIQANQDKNTSEILYGKEFDDSLASDESFGNYEDVESGLIDGTQSNSDKATQEVNDNFIGSLQRNVSGLAAVSGMFTDMLLTKIPDLNTIVWFSLAMGIVPLLVGLSVQGLRASDRAAAHARSRSTKGKGG